jgi:hypothetical protein
MYKINHQFLDYILYPKFIFFCSFCFKKQIKYFLLKFYYLKTFFEKNNNYFNQSIIIN